MPTVARLNVTPVKSTALHHPDEIELHPGGLAGDRRFLFLDEDGARLSGKDKAPLLAIRADYDPGMERLTLTLPDGTRVRGPARPTGSPFRVAMYDHEIEVREIPGPVADAVSRFLGRRLRLVRVAEGERGGGAPVVSLLSLSSVADLGERAARATPDPRRFRMLVELDGCAPHEEDGWEGRRIQIGEAVVRVNGPCLRCVLTDLDPDTGRADFPVLETLGAYRSFADGLHFGRYADVLEPGLVRVGDVVAPED